MIGMKNCKKIILSTTLILFFIFSVVHAEMDLSKPLTREQAKKLIEDRLFDIKISDNQAIEIAKKALNSQQEPREVTLNIFSLESETGESEYLFVWNVTFGDPENKEVLIDGSKGTILSIKFPTEIESQEYYQKIRPLGVLQNPIYLGLFSIIGILTVVLLLRVSRCIFPKKSR